MMNKTDVVGIIIVTFNPDIKDFKHNLIKINRLKQPMLIVDNGSSLKIQNELYSLKDISDNINVKFLKSNKGIGYAQNIGINYFQNIKPDFLFFLDQDSYITLTNFSYLIKTFRHLEKLDSQIVALGPTQDYEKIKEDNILTKELISSGSLIKNISFKKIGKFKEEYFIDYIDYEWNWRALVKGYHVYKTKNVKMVHETQGVNRVHGHTVDPVFRLYYIFRNSTYIILYEKVPWIIKINLIIRNTGKLIFQFRLNRKKDRIRMALKGIRDGAHKKLNYRIKSNESYW